MSGTGSTDGAGGLLAGRVVIVTGGGRGIGREHCLTLAGEGASVVIVDAGVSVEGREGPAHLDPGHDVANEIESRGGAAIVVEASVTEWATMKEVVAIVVETYGRLDGLVNNAGIVRDQMITSATEADFDAVVDVHLKGTFVATKHVCDYWRREAKAGRRPSGRIVNTTSGAGLFGNVGQAAYAAAKGAIISLTLVTALEMNRYGVTANSISPLALTRMTERVFATSDAAAGRLHPALSSPVVAYLVSEHSGWLSGQVLRIEGGMLKRMAPWSVAAERTAADGAAFGLEELMLAVPRLYGIHPEGLG